MVYFLQVREIIARNCTARLFSGDFQWTMRTLTSSVDLATRFYLQGQTQARIARDLGVDPATVSRHLKKARDEGIVRIEIRRPRRLHMDLGREIADRFGLKRAVVVANDDSSHWSSRRSFSRAKYSLQRLSSVPTTKSASSPRFVHVNGVGASNRTRFLPKAILPASKTIQRIT